jgi:glycosyltransferase involved in cell wall biosynthesis
MSDGSRGHVVVVSQHFPPEKSGNASRVHDTTKFLAQDGWDVTVLAPPPTFPHGEYPRSWEWTNTTEQDNITVHRLWAIQAISDDPSFLARLAYYITFPLHALFWLLIRSGAVDIVVTSSPPIFTGLAGLPFSLLGRTPVVVDVRDLWIDASVGLGFISADGIIEQLSRAYQRLVLQNAALVTVTTQELGSRLAEEYGLARSQIEHIPNGVEPDRFTPDEQSSKHEIVYTGNVGHAQDLESCIRAVDLLDRNDIRLRIVGDGDIRGELEALTDSLDLNGTVEFTGLVPRDEIPSILADAAIGLAPLKDNPTLEYAVPTKAYEYMASGLPVVATGSGEIERLVNSAEAGIVVENDAKALAETFERLLKDERVRAEFGNNGRTHIEGQYDRKKIAQSLSIALTTVMNSDV